jgi:hypothetical protein
MSFPDFSGTFGKLQLLKVPKNYSKLPPRTLYDNLRRLGVINCPERFNGVDVERLSNFFFDEIVIYSRK